MDSDWIYTKNKKGKIEKQLVLYPDADKSEAENESESDSNSFYSIISSDNSSCDEIIDDNESLIKWELNKNFEIQENNQIIFHSDQNIEEPFAYFNKFFTNELFEHIVNETNKYAIERGESFNTSFNEIQLYIGIIIKMSIARLPRYKDYWSCQLGYSFISEKISRNRFEKIKKFLHFCDNNYLTISQNNKFYDRFYKIRPVLNIIRNSCLKVEAEYNQCVDEQIIPFKGKSGLKRYIPSKPTKWGFKVYTRNGSSGIIHDFLFDDSQKIHTSNSTGYQSSDIVVKLCETLDINKYHIYYDNYFSTIRLHSTLMKMGHFSTSTIRKNRFKNCPFTDNKKFKKFKRGCFEYSMCNYMGSNVNAVQWLDGSVVTMTSTAHSIFPLGSINRYDRKLKKAIVIDYPNIIKNYNKNMGGVDLFDMLMAFYKMDHKSKKWYTRIFYWALNLCLINGWLVYKRQCKIQNNKNTLNLLDFCLSVSNTLIYSQINHNVIQKKGRPSSLNSSDLMLPITSRKYKLPETKTSETIRYDQISHFPDFSKSKVRCKFCGKHSRILCIKCQVHLCLNNNRNCFIIYHNK